MLPMPRLSRFARPFHAAAALGALALVGMAGQTIVLDNFEGDAKGAWPKRWTYVGLDGRFYAPSESAASGTERFTVETENGNQFLRLYTHDGVHRITHLTNQRGGTRWNMETTPTLTWRWRARMLPAGARETSSRLNDVGAAVYVTFGRDVLGRPRSIKYTYSTALPVGSSLREGALRVLVVASGRDGLGAWRLIERDVRADYTALFGGIAPDPLSITLWADTDNTHGESEVDVDDLLLR